MKHASKIIFVVLLLCILSAYFFFDLNQYLNLYWIKEQQSDFTSYYQKNPWQTLLLFAGAYILFTALSIPGAVFLTLLSGALFGFWDSLLLISFSATIGATLAFLISRWILHDWVQERFAHRLVKINIGFHKEGSFYLFSLRLVPLFPFFLVNLAMGLTPIRVLPYYIVSQLGMLPGTAVFVLAGTELGKLESIQGILDIKLIVAFSLIGILPLFSKRLLEAYRRKGASHEETKEV